MAQGWTEGRPLINSINIIVSTTSFCASEMLKFKFLKEQTTSRADPGAHSGDHIELLLLKLVLKIEKYKYSKTKGKFWETFNSITFFKNFGVCEIFQRTFLHIVLCPHR